MDALSYRLEIFEGPLDLLLSLIHKNKMAIDDIKINTEQSVSPMWAIALGAVVLAAGAAFVLVKKVLA